MKKKVLLFSLSLVISITAFSCGWDFTRTGKVNNENMIVEVSKQKGAEVTVNLNTIVKKTFSVKVSGNGTEKEVLANVHHIKLVISTNPADPYNYPVNASSFVVIGTGPGSVNQNTTVTFKGLKPNTSYFIAARAFNSSTENDANNITEGGTAFSAEEVNVDSNGLISIYNDDADDTWDITVPLLNQAGARIDTVITAKNGTLGNFAIVKFPINTTPGTNQTNPDVSVNQYGNGLAVWEDPQDGYPGLYARFIKDFLPDGNEFKADENTNSTLNVSNPSVYLNDAGNGFITWSKDAVFNIYYRHIINFKLQGNDTLLDASAQNQDNSKVSLGTSQGIIVWENDNGPDREINAKGIRTIDNFNSFGLGAGISISSGTNAFPDASKLNSSGDCLVVWQKGTNIKARKITVNSVPVVIPDVAYGEFQVNQNGSPNSQPSVSLNDNGDGLVVWNVNNDIIARRIVNYRPNGPEFVIDDNGSNQINPRVFINASGNGSVVWEDDRDDAGEIYGVNIINYNVVKDTYKVHPLTSNVQSVPAISMNENLKGIVIFEDEINPGSIDISGRRIVDLLPQ